MRALLRKEIRLLLPSFAVALVLTLSVWLIPLDNSSGSGLQNVFFIFPFVLCPAMLVLTALDSFGREISSGTFSNLLALPISRPSIWMTKTVLLAAAMGIIVGSWWLSYLLHAPWSFPTMDISNLIFGLSLFALAVFAGGQWTVLLFRQVAAAFWVTLIVPGALAGTVAGLALSTTSSRATSQPFLAAGFFEARRSMRSFLESALALSPRSNLPEILLELNCCDWT